MLYFKSVEKRWPKGFTLWPPKSDKHLIYPCSITPESNTKVMNVKEMITNLKKKLLIVTQILFVSTFGNV